MFELKYDALRLTPVFLKGGVAVEGVRVRDHRTARASETVVPGLPVGGHVAGRPDAPCCSLNGLNVANGYRCQVWLVPDIDAFADLFGIYSNERHVRLSSTVASARGNNRASREKTIGFFQDATRLVRHSTGRHDPAARQPRRALRRDHQRKSTGYSRGQQHVPVLTTDRTRLHDDCCRR
jgi:hypothetical protein